MIFFEHVLDVREGVNVFSFAPLCRRHRWCDIICSVYTIQHFAPYAEKFRPNKKKWHSFDLKNY